MFKSIIPAAAAALIAAPALAAGVSADNPIRIGAGKEGGGYDTAAKSLCAGLVKNDIPCVVVNYDGSEDIINAIEADAIDYGWSQPDVPFILGVNTKRTAKGFEEVGVMACGKGSRLDQLSDLDEDHSVIIGPLGSGGAMSWDGLIRSEKEGATWTSDWIEATPVFSDLTDGVLEVEDGEAHCIFAVARPTSSTFKAWKDAGLVFADLDDGDLDDLERNGESVYPIEEREVAGVEVDVAVLPASLYRSTGAEAKSPQALKLLRRLARSVR